MKLLLPTGNAVLFYFLLLSTPPMTWTYPASSSVRQPVQGYNYYQSQPRLLHAEPRQYSDDTMTGRDYRQWFDNGNQQPTNPWAYQQSQPQNGAQGRNYGDGYNGRYRKPFDLATPVFAYVPEEYTGAMSYLPHPPVFAAGTPGRYIQDWNNYQANFRETGVPVTPAYDSLWENMIAYIDGHPVTQSPTAVKAQQPKLTIITNTSKPCSSGSSFGICINNSQVTELCIGKTVAKSVICQKMQSCCLDSGVETQVSVPKDNRMFKPCGTFVRGVSVFGVCVNDNSLGGFCKGKFISVSDQCQSEESCCSDAQPDVLQDRRRAALVMKTTLPPTTTPFTQLLQSRFRPCVSAKSTQLGVCIDDIFLGQFCMDQFISKSTNCALSQSCCIDESNLSQPSTTTSTPAVVRRPLPTVKHFNIRRRNQPISREQPTTTPTPTCANSQSTTLGICVADFVVAEKCSGKAVFRSDDCFPGETCCVAIEASTTILPTTILRQSTFIPCVSGGDKMSEGICVDNNLVSSLCTGRIISQSPDCLQSRQSCCTEPAQKSQLDVRTLLENTVKSCSTSGEGLQLGVCVLDVDVSLQCVGEFIAKSLDCSDEETCCVEEDQTQETVTSATTTTTTSSTRIKMEFVWPKIFQQCIPIVNNFPAGVCVAESQVQHLCTRRLVAPSINCSLTQSCCSYFPEMVYAS